MHVHHVPGLVILEFNVAAKLIGMSGSRIRSFFILVASRFRDVLPVSSACLDSVAMQKGIKPTGNVRRL